jgi:hypothetical protein
VGISADVIWGRKYEKGKRKQGKCKRKREKGGKKKRKGEVKRYTKKMQNREELRQKGHNRSLKINCYEMGKISF